MLSHVSRFFIVTQWCFTIPSLSLIVTHTMVASLFTNNLRYFSRWVIIQWDFNININIQHNMCTNCKIPLTGKIFLYQLGLIF